MKVLVISKYLQVSIFLPPISSQFPPQVFPFFGFSSLLWVWPFSGICNRGGLHDLSCSFPTGTSPSFLFVHRDPASCWGRLCLNWRIFRRANISLLGNQFWNLGTSFPTGYTPKTFTSLVFSLEIGKYLRIWTRVILKLHRSSVLDRRYEQLCLLRPFTFFVFFVINDPSHLFRLSCIGTRVRMSRASSVLSPPLPRSRFFDLFLFLNLFPEKLGTNVLTARSLTIQFFGMNWILPSVGCSFLPHIVYF